MCPIYDVTPFTMLDYPGHLACIVWLPGCSMRCPYCYNPDIVAAGAVQHSEHNLFDFLAERRDRLDGVVFSGGECTACCELPELCAQVKDAGFKVKLDTNGTYPHTLATMIAGGLVDYIALDYKAPYYKFEQVTGSRLFSQFSQSLDLLIDSNLDFEVRTTFHSALLDSADIHGIASDLQQRGYTGTLYIQNFVNGTKTLGSPGESRRLLPAELSDFPVKVELRE